MLVWYWLRLSWCNLRCYASLTLGSHIPNTLIHKWKSIGIEFVLRVKTTLHFQRWPSVLGATNMPRPRKEGKKSQEWLPIKYLCECWYHDVGHMYVENLCPSFKRPSNMVPSLKSLDVNPCNLNCWKTWKLGLPTSHGAQVRSPKYDMDAYMATLFGGEAWDLCWQLGWTKSRIQLSTQVIWRILLEKNWDPTSMIIDHILMAPWGSKGGTLPSMLGLAYLTMSGTWDPGRGTPCEPALSHLAKFDTNLWWLRCWRMA